MDSRIKRNYRSRKNKNACREMNDPFLVIQTTDRKLQCKIISSSSIAGAAKVGNINFIAVLRKVSVVTCERPVCSTGRRNYLAPSKPCSKEENKNQDTSVSLHIPNLQYCTATPCCLSARNQYH